MLLVFICLLLLNCCSSRPLSPHTAAVLLAKYGYLSNVSHVASPSALYRDSALSSALGRFQTFFRLPGPRGHLSQAVAALLSSPRCGNRDPSSARLPDHSHSRVKRFFIDDPKRRWLKTKLTWRIQAYPTNGGLSKAHVRAIFTTAFNLWSAVISLEFREELDHLKQVDIVILFGRREHGDSLPFDGKDLVLAHAFYPLGSNSPAYSRSGDAHFDDDEKWVASRNPHGKNLLAVAVHELGHSMGLGHSGSQDAIMYPFYVALRNRKLSLNEDDILGMQAIYGPAAPNRELPVIPEVPDTPESKPGLDRQPGVTKPPIRTRPPQRSAINLCNVTVDAIIFIRETELFVFSGKLQWRVDYSRTVTSWISYELRDGPHKLQYYWPVLPAWIERIDAGLERDDQKIYIFSGPRFWLLDDNRRLANGVPEAGLSLSSLGLPKNLLRVDTVFRWGYNRGVYIMAGQRYWRLDERLGQFGTVMKRYPRLITAVWHGVPLPIDMAFTGLHGKTVFAKDGYYHEFNDLEMTVEMEKPRPLHEPWIGCNS